MSHDNIHLILGGPGTGKTTRLLSILEDHLNQGVPPEAIAFVSFTRKAVTEAVDRSVEKFGFKKSRFTYFKTLHATAFAEMGYRRKDIFGPKHYKRVGELIGMDVSAKTVLNSPNQSTEGDKAIFIDNYARITKKTPYEVWEVMGEYIPWKSIEYFIEMIQKFKQTYGLVDFTDLLVEHIENAIPLPVQVAIVDEAQDLSPLQWDLVYKIFAGAKVLYVAGDDDQAIYKWSGADIDQFLNIPYKKKEVLPKSWRLGREVFEYTQTTLERIDSRYAKKWDPAEHKSEVRFVRDIDKLNVKPGESWLMLARNKHLLSQYYDLARRQFFPYETISGIRAIVPQDVIAIRDYINMQNGEKVLGARVKTVFEYLGRSNNSLVDAKTYGMEVFGQFPGPWTKSFVKISQEDRVYYAAVKSAGWSVFNECPITINTIHSVKGGEADNVVLIMDVSRRTYEHYQKDSDDEFRVFYVGMTRAKKTLYIVLPKTIRYMPYV
jgi:superfamily I DNA/RNA helicase